MQNDSFNQAWSLRAVTLAALALPILALPILAQPILAQPILAQPILAGPALAGPSLAKSAVTTVPVEAAPQAKLKAPAIRRHPSPDRKAVVIESGDVSEGDFPQAALYLQVGGKAYNLGSYRSVRSVTWAKDSLSVTFEGAQLKDYGIDDVVRVTYKLGRKTMERKVLRQEKDEPTG